MVLSMISITYNYNIYLWRMTMAMIVVQEMYL